MKEFVKPSPHLHNHQDTYVPKSELKKDPLR